MANPKNTPRLEPYKTLLFAHRWQVQPPLVSEQYLEALKGRFSDILEDFMEQYAHGAYFAHAG